MLVHDEAGLYEQDLDGRLGFVNPVGLGVVTRAGDFLGKVTVGGRGRDVVAGSSPAVLLPFEPS